MTSTCSAAADALPAQTIASAIAASEQLLGVGPIEASYPEWVMKRRLADKAGRALAALTKGFEEPELPRFNMTKDEGAHLTLVGDRPGRFISCVDVSDENVAHLQAKFARKPENAWHAKQLSYGAARAQETLDKILAWRAERDQRRDAVGLSVATMAARKAESEAADAKAALLAIPAANFREAAFKAAVINTDGSTGEAVRLLEEIQSLADIPAYDEED